MLLRFLRAMNKKGVYILCLRLKRIEVRQRDLMLQRAVKSKEQKLTRVIF